MPKETFEIKHGRATKKKNTTNTLLQAYLQFYDLEIGSISLWTLINAMHFFVCGKWNQSRRLSRVVSLYIAAKELLMTRKKSNVFSSLISLHLIVTYWNDAVSATCYWNRTQQYTIKTKRIDTSERKKNVQNHQSKIKWEKKRNERTKKNCIKNT